MLRGFRERGRKEKVEERGEMTEGERETKPITMNEREWQKREMKAVTERNKEREWEKREMRAVTERN